MLMIIIMHFSPLLGLKVKIRKYEFEKVNSMLAMSEKTSLIRV
jgi:hypothetical protein